jgi:hypothetical protein
VVPGDATTDEALRRPERRRPGPQTAADGRPGSWRSRVADHQRFVVIALALNEVPIDVLAERLGTTRGALYETLREARLAIRIGLAEASPDR